jgi:hypothetical protein
MLRSFLLITLIFVAHSASAVIVTFDLQGQAGAGLISGNAVNAITTTPNPVGAGGEIGTGITYDTNTMVLSVNVGWGTGNSFATDLSGNATVAHIHGPAPQTGTAGVVFNLLGGTNGVNYSQDATNGFVDDTFTLTTGQQAELYSGQYYINIHTSQNPAGEIRGNLVATSPIPEPSTYALIFGGLAIVGVVMRRRFKRN